VTRDRISLVYDKATCILFSIPFPYLGSVFYHIGNRACFMCGLLSFAISKENMDEIATPHIILKCVSITNILFITCSSILGEWSIVISTQNIYYKRMQTTTVEIIGAQTNTSFQAEQNTRSRAEAKNGTGTG
ncbi:hypothetical protein ACJX0J_015423, partial [Zea mays]